MAAQYGLQDVGRALVRNVLQHDARLQRKLFYGQVRRGARAGVPISHLTRMRFGVGHQFF